jgi:SAM-dependent methyltransferase
MSIYNNMSIYKYLDWELSKFPKNNKKSLLDLGCGSLPYKPIYKERFSINIAGDYDIRGAIDVRLDAINLPFPDNSFDVVIFSEVIEHIPNPEAAVIEISRVLKNGGVLLITWPFNYMMHEVPFNYFNITEFGMQHMAKNTGMSIEHIFRRGGVIIVLTALIEFLIFGFFEALCRVPILGPMFLPIKKYLVAVPFFIFYKVFLYFHFKVNTQKIEPGDGLKGIRGQMELWNIGYCARIRKL